MSRHYKSRHVLPHLCIPNNFINQYQVQSELVTLFSSSLIIIPKSTLELIMTPQKASPSRPCPRGSTFSTQTDIGTHTYNVGTYNIATQKLGSSESCSDGTTD